MGLYRSRRLRVAAIRSDRQKFQGRLRLRGDAPFVLGRIFGHGRSTDGKEGAGRVFTRSFPG